MDQCKYDIGDDFAVHAELLAELFIVKDIVKDEKKRSYLLTSLSTRVYKLLRNLTSPKAPTEVDYVELLKLLKNQFVDKAVVFKERRAFYEAAQEVGEDCRTFFNKIKSLSVTCDFGADLNKILRDRFVSGMQKGLIFDRICEEDKEITIDKCLEIARAKENVCEKLSCNKIVQRKKIGGKKVMSSSLVKCNACGKSNHDFKKCKYRGYICRKCKAKGHLEVVCNGKSQQPVKNNYIETLDNGDQVEEVDELLSLFTITIDDDLEWRRDTLKRIKDDNGEMCCDCVSKREVPALMKVTHEETVISEPGLQISTDAGEMNADFKGKNCQLISNNLAFDKFSKTNYCNFFRNTSAFMVALEVEGILINFEIDTGSAVSIIPEHLYKKNFITCQAKDFKSTLRAYNGALIDVIGVIMVRAKFNRIIKSVPLVVIKSNGPPLIGRDLLKVFNFEFSFNCNVNQIVESIEFKNFKQVLNTFDDVFENSLGKYKFDKIRLEVENVQPIFVKPRKVPFAYKEHLEIELNRLEQLGIIRKTDTVSWGTPLVTVLKKNNSIRVCADYSVTINKFLKERNYPLPRIEEIFQALQGGKIFTKLDLSHAYYQLEVDDDTSKLLAWSTHKGVYTVHRLPFGCKPNSAIFQSIIDKTLSGCQGTVAFMDDVVVTGRSDKEHMQNLTLVLQRFRDAGFRINRDKCEFNQKKIAYLGYVIDEEGLHKDAKKVEAIVNMPTPNSITQIKSFCGLVNYYGKFIPNVSSILKPLYDAATKNKFEWSAQCELAMTKVKELIVSDTVLVHFDPEKPLILHTDASDYGIGACLSHKMKNGTERPIIFISRTLSSHERNYSMIDKESLAIYFGVRKCAQYLLGRKFEIKTDHKPLVGIFGSKKGLPTMSANRLQRWAIYLANFDFVINHISGKNNNCADALSRLTSAKDDELDDDVSYLNFIQTKFARPINISDLVKQTRKDLMLDKVYGYVERGWPNLKKCEGELRSLYEKRNELTIENGVLMWGHRAIIPSAFRQQLLYEVHSAHLGIVKCKELVRSYFWWPNVDKDIASLVNNCDVCRMCQSNPKKCQPKSWPQTSRPMERVHIDFCGPIENHYYLVLIDAYSRWLEVVKMRSITTKQTISKLMQIFSVIGIPDTLVSDNGTSLVSDEFEKFLASQGIKHLTSPPYHPASNGPAENGVRIFKKAFEKLSADPQNESLSIDDKISKLLYFKRNSTQAKLNCSPFELMFRRKPTLRWDFLTKVVKDKQSGDDCANRKGIRRFKINENVYFRNFGSGKKWVQGVIKKLTGDRVYEVESLGNKTFKRHVDHIISRNDNPSALFKPIQSKNSSDYESIISAKIKNFEVNLPTTNNNTPENVTSNDNEMQGSVAQGVDVQSESETDEFFEVENSDQPVIAEPSATMNNRRKSERKIKCPIRLNL